MQARVSNNDDDGDDDDGYTPLMRRMSALSCFLAALPFACICEVTAPPPDIVPAPSTTPASPVRRLTAEELNRTLRDLFPLTVLPAVEFTEDRGNDFAQDTSRQVVSDLFVEQLRANINVVVTAVVADRAALLPRQPAGIDDEAAVVDELLQSLLVRVFRRPVTNDERQRFVAFFVARRADADSSFNAALQLTLQGVLQSPAFLYRLEINDDAVDVDEEDCVPVTSIEMASRLSYFLWGTMPDTALLQAGIDGELSTSAGVAAQTARLLADPKSKDAVLSFHRQWLDFDRILVSNKSPQRFPQYNEFIRQAMRREADQFIAMLFEQDATLTSLLTSKQTRVLPALNSIYGTNATTDDEQVTLPAERSGVLTQAWFLGSRGHAVEGSPVLRGVFLLDRLICEPPPAPDGSIDTTPPQPEEGVALTNRDRYREHSSSPVCFSCHQAIDGVGFGLEAFDAVGAFRTVDNGQAVDASGTLDGTRIGGSYTGAVELGQALAASNVVHDCVARQWFRFATGRREQAFDGDDIDKAVGEFEAANTDIRVLLQSLVTTDAFRLRRAK